MVVSQQLLAIIKAGFSEMFRNLPNNNNKQTPKLMLTQQYLRKPALICPSMITGLSRTCLLNKIIHLSGPCN